MIYALIRSLHLISIAILVGAILIENLAVKPVISREDAVNLARVDAVAGIAAILTLLFGLLLWFSVGKPPEFYSGNPVFHSKIALFALLLALAVYPALFFFNHRNSESQSLAVPKSIRILLKCEAVIMLVIPFLAFLMARGVGLPG